ncbi:MULTISPECIES: response regulator transcription factor [Actinoalloteichus]|uniref:Transcriptional regulatory protein CutR n=1 Tax=Actinoalloteichus fjordicus TaxID=1612552 RepID=A0AAC9PR61_9PSEU|nr:MULTISPECIES: response regulator transcription factor [Actinoalloteichus]APU13627.1 Transcriptional regulatory protein CutR [Actinoalloteichus fjordicus]APU19573.1 Transcriptional regulatory protein CutR [Actinoalloteichus sp. GBA129-24]
MRVLVAEDEKALAGYIAEGLRDESMSVDLAYDGTTALEKLSADCYDVVVLDRDLPGTHGDEVCRQLVEYGGLTRVLMLTALADVPDRIAGLRLGADDYLGKPFDFDELVARLHALGRRSRPAVPPVLRRHGIALDSARRSVSRDDRPVALSNKEFGVLAVLMAADGTIVSAEELLRVVWDEHADPFTNAVRVTMCRLRAKLGSPGVIETLPGVGYRLGGPRC